ncbi:MAG: methyltransferase domain-containing protein [Chloroflexota bacterium]
MAQVKRFIPEGSTLLDIGSGDGQFVRGMMGHVKHAVGIEPSLTQSFQGRGYKLIAGRFPDDLPAGKTFDVITLLAVLEHLPRQVQGCLGDAFVASLNTGGRVVITVPSPRVDDILHLLLRLRLIAGIALHEHYGFKPADTLGLFPMPHFRVLRRSTFQLGLNNLFVFERT